MLITIRRTNQQDREEWWLLIIARIIDTKNNNNNNENEKKEKRNKYSTTKHEVTSFFINVRSLFFLHSVEIFIVLHIHPYSGTQTFCLRSHAAVHSCILPGYQYNRKFCLPVCLRWWWCTIVVNIDHDIDHFEFFFMLIFFFRC